MRTTLKILIGCVVLALVLAIGITYYERDLGPVSSFSECERAGYPVTGSPRTCTLPDGTRFTEALSGELSADVVAAIERKRDLIVLEKPQPLDTVTSPLVIRGKARGPWYFEASFPVRIEDANGTPVASHYAEATDEWMTERFVSFTGTLTFLPPTTPTGMLILERSNPSGLPEHDDELRIPVRFNTEQTADTRTQTIDLYYYDPARDLDADGNVLCSAQGLVKVERSIPHSDTPIQDTVRLLLSGTLTREEAAQGISTEFPLPGLELTGASVRDGVLTLSFNDPNSRTTGGACRTGVLWAQIERTAQQFDIVREVRFVPEELFQP